MPKINKEKIKKEKFLFSNFVGVMIHGKNNQYAVKFPVTDIIKNLQEILTEFGDTIYIVSDPYSDFNEYNLYKKVIETDEEYETRMEHNKKARLRAKKTREKGKKDKEEKDLKEWVRLQKKFGEGE